jgi:excisionase family DNA binding protein
VTEILLSVEETARRLGGISKWTVHAWLSQGKLQRTKVGGRTMIRESELQKVIQDGGKSPSSARQGRGGRARVKEAPSQPIFTPER